MIKQFTDNCELRPDIAKHFKRSNLKPTIMLSNYNAKYVTCLGSFICSLPMDISDAFYEEVKRGYDKFYEYVQSVFAGDNLFKHNSKFVISIIAEAGALTSDIEGSSVGADLKSVSLGKLDRMAHLLKNPNFVTNCDVRDLGGSSGSDFGRYFIVMGDSFSVSHGYLRSDNKKVDIKLRGSDVHLIEAYVLKYRDMMVQEPVIIQRTTISLNLFGMVVDPERTETAFRPNLVHSIDALIVRRIVLNFKGDLLSIHDSVGCRYIELGSLVDVVKDSYNRIVFTCDGLEYTTATEVTGRFIMS